MRNKLLTVLALIAAWGGTALAQEGNPVRSIPLSGGLIPAQGDQRDLVKITKERIPMDKRLLALCVGPQAVVGPHVAAEVDVYVNPTVIDYRRKNPDSYSYPLGSQFVKKKYPRIGAKTPDIATVMVKKADTGKITDWEFSMVRLSDGKPLTPRGRNSCAACHERYEARGYISRESESALQEYLRSSKQAEQGGAGQLAAAVESKAESSETPKPESEESDIKDGITNVLAQPRAAERAGTQPNPTKDTLNARIRKLKHIQSVGGVSLANLGLKYVKPHRDKKTGFLIGGSNSTETILSLDSLNGIRIEALERQMRPGASGMAGSDAGFLGDSESLLKVLADDNRFVVEEQGLTHQDLARPLLLLGNCARKHRGGKEIELGDLTFIVRALRYSGSQYSPFADGTSTSTDVTIINKQTGHGLTYSLLVPLMIERYGFYEGKGTSYRVDPKMIIDVLRTEKSTDTGQYQRLAFQPTTDRELQQALAVAAPTALTELDLWNTEITDVGVAELSKLKNLQRLNLADTKITDESLAVIAQLSNLTELWLAGTQISDAGLKHLSGLKKLTKLNLIRNDISDQGLEALSTLTLLEELSLSETKVTDDGLKSLLAMRSLTELGLIRTRITDKGLLMLSDLPSLKQIHTYGTHVTKEGQKGFDRRLRERSSPGG